MTVDGLPGEAVAAGAGNQRDGDGSAAGTRVGGGVVVDVFGERVNVFLLAGEDRGGASGRGRRFRHEADLHQLHRMAVAAARCAAHESLGAKLGQKQADAPLRGRDRLSRHDAGPAHLLPFAVEQGTLVEREVELTNGCLDLAPLGDVGFQRRAARASLRHLLLLGLERAASGGELDLDAAELGFCLCDRRLLGLQAGARDGELFSCRNKLGRSLRDACMSLTRVRLRLGSR